MSRRLNASRARRTDWTLSSDTAPIVAAVGSRRMRAVPVRDGELLLEEHPDPTPGTGEVLVRVRAAGLNGGDEMQRRGLYPAPPGSPPDIAGMALAGDAAP